MAAGKREGSHLQWAKGKRKKGWELLRGRTLSLEASKCSRALSTYVATTSRLGRRLLGRCLALSCETRWVSPRIGTEARDESGMQDKVAGRASPTASLWVSLPCNNNEAITLRDRQHVRGLQGVRLRTTSVMESRLLSLQPRGGCGWEGKPREVKELVQRLMGRARGRVTSTDGQTQGRNRHPGRGRRGARRIQPDRSSVGCDGSSTDKQILKGELGGSVTPTHRDTVSIIRNTFFSPPDCN